MELFNQKEQMILWWVERQFTFFPQFIMGTANMVANSLSRGQQVLGSEWTLVQDVVTCLISLGSDVGFLCDVPELPSFK